MRKIWMWVRDTALLAFLLFVVFPCWALNDALFGRPGSGRGGLLNGWKYKKPSR